MARGASGSGGGGASKGQGKMSVKSGQSSAYRRDMGKSEHHMGKAERQAAKLARDRRRTKDAKNKPVSPMTVFAVFFVGVIAILALVLSDPSSLKAGDTPTQMPRNWDPTAKSQLKIEKEHVPEQCPRKSKTGDKLSMHYRGSLLTGTEFDSSHERGPFTFELGGGNVIRGWDEGLKDMCVGEKRTLTIPPHMGYGERGAGGVIPPGATLLFDVELVAFADSS